jgi:hypothetical protein
VLKLEEMAVTRRTRRTRRTGMKRKRKMKRT